MKKNINVIQIKGVKGIIMAIGIVSCLIAGFIAFPGWICMNIWNFISEYSSNIPMIGLFQGILLWGIIVASYLLLRKEKVVVCMKSPEGLSDEELKAVFADMKKQTMEDPILQAMLKARETEIQLKAQELQQKTEAETSIDSENSKVN